MNCGDTAWRRRAFSAETTTGQQSCRHTARRRGAAICFGLGRRDGFRGVAAGAQFGADVCRRGFGADAGDGGSMAAVSRRARLVRIRVLIADLRSGGFVVAGTGRGDDGRRGRNPCGLVERGRTAGRAGSRPSPVSGSRVRGCASGHRASGDYLGQQDPAAKAGGLERVGPKRPGDRRRRGRI